MPDIFDEARDLITGQRADDYGDAQENFDRIARMWGAYLGQDVSASQVAHMMILLKVSRLANTPDHHDSAVDAIGYAALADRLDRGADVIEAKDVPTRSKDWAHPVPGQSYYDDGEVELR